MILVRATAVFLMASASFAGLPLPAAAADLALERVVLSSGGVGYFGYEGVVEGDATLSFEASVGDIDDILKSLVVFDAEGRIAQVTLPGREPLEQVFAEFPFDRDALASPQALLDALSGAEVRSVGGRSLEGRLLSVVPEETYLDDGRTTLQHRVTVQTADGLQQFVIEQVEAVRFADATLQVQVEKALAALSTHRARDRRQIAISVEGEGRRTVGLGYVVAAPLWKATYRLVLEPGAAESRMQGWAVLENMSGRDWTGVDLTLVSGNPVTFRQALYEAYYVDRPEVPVEVMGRVLPRTDTGDVALDEAAAEEKAEDRAMLRVAAGMAAAAPAYDRVPAPGAAAAEARQAIAQVAFDYPLPVDLAAGHSLTLPIIDRALPVERVALYQPETDETHPLAAVRVTNGAETGLPPGVLTLYQRGGADGLLYLGDARLAPFPAGEERMVSFALDLGTRVDRVRESRETVTGAAVSEGVLRITRREREITRYTAAAPEGEGRTVVIEHPRRQGWALAAPESGVSAAPNHYRIERRLAAGAVETIAAVLERSVTERLQIGALSPGRLAAFAEASALSEETRQAFAHLAALQRDAVRLESRLGEIESERQRIVEDQARLRENLQAVPPDSALYRRYLVSLAETEDRLDSLAAERAETGQALREARTAVADFIAGLDL